MLCLDSYNTRKQTIRQFMEVMNNPERREEADAFLQSRVITEQNSNP